MYKAAPDRFRHRRLVLLGYIDVHLWMWICMYIPGPADANCSAISAVRN